LVQLAREHFGALTRLCVYDSVSQALADVSRGAASVAVLPYPSETDTWWIALLHHQPRLHIIGRLPFWGPRPDGLSSVQAFVIASTPADASGEDRSILGFECGSDISFARLSSEMTAAGLTLQSMMLTRQQTRSLAVLAEIDGYIPDDDSRLGQLEIGSRRPIVLGSYAVPIEGAAQ
jgi:chorismate mutase/prephenate dehydratase